LIRQRIASLMCFFLLMFIILASVIAYYQIIKGPAIAREAAAMRNREIEIKEYPRGEIYDRNHLPLTGCNNAAALYCIPGEIGDGLNREESLADAAAVLAGCLEDKNSQEIQSILEEAVFQGKALVRVASDLKQHEIDAINASGLSGVICAPVLKRYRSDGYCAHLLGYVGKGEDGDGKAGLEKLYNEILQGSDSTREIVSVQDARGITIQGLMFRMRQEQESEQSSLVLTIDSRVQELVEQVMNEKVSQGAVVVLDTDSREILAMASRPTFNPYADMEYLIENDELSSLSNRALSRYHPGSMFKILVSAAALEEGVVQIDDRFICTGSYKFTDELAIPCWKKEGHGEINFAEAFAMSCNPSFIEVGLNLNRERLLNYVKNFHITDETLLGYCSDQEYTYVDVVEHVKPALANACLGQQGVMLSPLEIASLIATIADDGRWLSPSLVLYSINHEGLRTSITPPEKEQVISEKTARTVQNLMEKTVSEGTGKTAALSEVRVAGKTATSQVGIISEGDESREVLNTWFGGYFPADNPCWAIVVLVEDGTSGAKDAAPVFKEIARGILDLYPTGGVKK